MTNSDSPMHVKRQLAIPLEQRQVNAAWEFWKDAWESQDFATIKAAFPKALDAIRIKAIVLNALYATRIIAIAQAADRVERVLKTNQSTGADLVEALVNEIHEVTKRGEYSFAAKYTHFFVDSAVPILDRYAERMLKRHLVVQMRSKDPRRYHRFTEDIETLKQVARLNCNCAQLDAYLWVAGVYWYWKDHPSKPINGDLKVHFENLHRDPTTEPKLAALLGMA